MHEELCVPLSGIETKANGDVITQITGYGAVFNNIDDHGEVILPGAFTKTISERLKTGQIKALNGHAQHGDSVIGTVVAAVEDAKGLLVTIAVSAAQSAQDVALKVKEGHLDRMSIGFRTIRESFEERNGRHVRLLHEIKLFEVSVVAIPANAAANIIGAKSVVDIMPSFPIAHPWTEDIAGSALATLRRHEETKGRAESMRLAHVVRDPSYVEGPHGYRYLVGQPTESGDVFLVPAAVKSAAVALERDKADLDPPLYEQARETLSRHFEAVRKSNPHASFLAPWEGDGVLERLAASSEGDNMEDVKDAVALIARCDEGTKAALLSAAGSPVEPDTSEEDAVEDDETLTVGTKRLEARERLLMGRLGKDGGER